MNGDQAHKVFYMSDEQRWREVRRLLKELYACPAEGAPEESLCRDCWGHIGDIEEIVDMTLAGIDGPFR